MTLLSKQVIESLACDDCDPVIREVEEYAVIASIIVVNHDEEVENEWAI